ncbi:MAG: ATP-binding protein [Clostridiales Family XIII bacterium]|jgi:predicted AAA+ superfamily ATPase|nr:ATP-binding protein [Clostridiales Family XIII bacterium]
MKRKIDEQLLRWKNKKQRKPLIVNGARQVGKTYSLMAFGRSHYDNVIHVNLDVNSIVRGFFDEDISPKYIIRMLESDAHEKIEPGKTLIILDEIQASERALTSLKYFYEEAPEYHVVAAGSLLGVAVNREKYSFPVGKVETVTMYPLDFEEYLIAADEKFLAGEIREAYGSVRALPAALHEKAKRLYLEYLIIGGMPACVSATQDGASLIEMPELQSGIMNDYIADMAKYASASDSVKIRACYNSIPAQLGKENRKFQYKVVQKGGTAGLFGASIEWLHFAGVVLKCGKTEVGSSPIAAYEDLSSFKLYMSDVGMLTMKSGIQQSILLSGQHNIFTGALTENYVAQHLQTLGAPLFYWRSAHAAEVDFVIERQGGICAIEVKRGDHKASKSLSVFIEKYKPERAIRLSLRNFGSANGIYAIPLYAAFCLSDLPGFASSP